MWLVAEVATAALAMEEACWEEIFQTLMCMNEAIGLKKDKISSGGTLYLVQNACQYSICRNSPIVTIWAGSSNPVVISTTP